MRRYIHSMLMMLFLSAFAIAGQYKMDKSHTSVGFDVSHMVITTVSGTFNDFDVNLNFDPMDLSAFSVKATIKIASVDTDNEKRDDHLRSADFFAADDHPDMVFSSNKLEKTENGYVAHGTLTMRGVSKQVALPFEVKGPVVGPWGNERIGVKAELVLNRHDYGVKWSKSMDNGGLVVGDEVLVKINAQFIASK